LPRSLSFSLSLSLSHAFFLTLFQTNKALINSSRSQLAGPNQTIPQGLSFSLSLSFTLTLSLSLSHTLFQTKQGRSSQDRAEEVCQVSLFFTLSFSLSHTHSLRRNKALSPSKLFCFNSALLSHVVILRFHLKLPHAVIPDRRLHGLLQFSQVSVSLSLPLSSFPFFLYLQDQTKPSHQRRKLSPLSFCVEPRSERFFLHGFNAVTEETMSLNGIHSLQQSSLANADKALSMRCSNSLLKTDKTVLPLLAIYASILLYYPPLYHLFSIRASQPLPTTRSLSVSPTSNKAHTFSNCHAYRSYGSTREHDVATCDSESSSTATDH
jgi:hypothetical protein